MAPPHHAFYNTLPLIEEAEEAFTANSVFEALKPLFIAHPTFAPCLVHRHSALNEGEKMVSSTCDPNYFSVTRPIVTEDAYPDAWAIDGDGTFQPFEFSSIKVPKIPKPLRIAYKKVVQRGPTWKGVFILGLSYVGDRSVFMSSSFRRRAA